MAVERSFGLGRAGKSLVARLSLLALDRVLTILHHHLAKVHRRHLTGLLGNHWVAAATHAMLFLDHAMLDGAHVHRLHPVQVAKQTQTVIS